MAENSKPEDTQGGQDNVREHDPGTVSQAEDEIENDDADEQAVGAASGSTTRKKKKSKKKRGKACLPGTAEESVDTSKALSRPSDEEVQEIIRQNPALAHQLGAGTETSAPLERMQEGLKRLRLEEIMTGLASGGKNVKDMASYKFWGTQPVPKFGESEKVIEEGPFKIIDPEQVSKVPVPLIDGFEWVTMDLTDDKEIEEIFTLLYGHYVEDDEAMFRFNYSKAFLKWYLQTSSASIDANNYRALMSPGWTKDWHVGVRATTSRKLVAFISAIPATLRVRNKILHASEVNFLCIHKKLRAKRLTPVLIKEITRRCYLRQVWQAIYTAGVVLPKPISTCRYFHRSLDWQKLYDVKFCSLPPNSKPAYQVRKYALPENTATKNLRPMEQKDAGQVLSLLKRYLEKFELAPVFSLEEVEHWLVPKPGAPQDQVIWSHVVEVSLPLLPFQIFVTDVNAQDPTSKVLTDFFSFYCLESSVINHSKHKNVRAAYMFYYATEHGLSDKIPWNEYSSHLNTLMNDALILAKRFKFDVFNALTLMDNNLFLQQQKFGAGDGQLHYYLFNYNANPVAGGLDSKNSIDGLSGVGVVML